MEPREFQKLAERLACGKGGAAEYRTAVSRAYYAAFLSCRKALDRIEIRPLRNDGAHKHVVTCLGSSGIEECRVLSDNLDALRTWRNHADYDLDCADVEQFDTVKDLIDDASEIISGIGKVECRTDWKSYGAAALKQRAVSPKRPGKPK